MERTIVEYDKEKTMEAKQAKEIANNYHKEHQCKLIELKICEEAAKGMYKLSWLNLTKNTKVVLEAKGYKISGNGEGYMGPSYEISWE